MEPFSIACTTCQARLRVRDESVIGQILTCPKCGSMVLVEPTGAAADSAQEIKASAPHDSAPHDSGSADATALPQHDSATAADLEDAASVFDETSHPAPPASPDMIDTVEDFSVHKESKPRARDSRIGTQSARGWKDSAEAGESDAEASAPLSPPPLPASDDVLLPNGDWTSASTVRWRNRILTGIAAVVGVVLALLLLIVFSGGDEPATVASAPTSPVTDSGEDGSTGPTQHEPNDQVDAAAPAAEEAADDASFGAMPDDAATDDSTEPPIESTSEVPAPDAPDPDPPPIAVEPAAEPPADPLTAEPPGLTPQEPIADTAPVAAGESGPLAETLRGFEALLDRTDEPASPPAEVETDVPPAPVEDESEDAPRVRRTGPRVVEVDDRLNDLVKQIELDSIPLVNFLRIISDYSTIPITLDADILPWTRVSPITAVKLTASDATVADILSQGLAPLGLEYRIEPGQLFITRRPKDESGIRTVPFKVDDLVGDDAEKLQQLGARIMDFVEPDSWSSRGGTGTITFRGSELVIEQSETVQFEILGFCEKLRVVRGLATRGPFDAAMFRVKTRAERARDKLAKPITLTYIEPAPLQDIVDQIAQLAELNILIDWRALAEADWSPDASVRFVVAKQPLEKALATLLEPMDLAYRVIDGSLLQITTPDVVDSRLEVEFYRVPKPDDGGAALVQSVRGALGPANFRDAGRSGQIAFDEPSNCLLACLSQTRQLELQAWLAAQAKLAIVPAAAEKTTPTATVESRIVPASGRVLND